MYSSVLFLGWRCITAVIVKARSVNTSRLETTLQLLFSIGNRLNYVTVLLSFPVFDMLKFNVAFV